MTSFQVIPAELNQGAAKIEELENTADNLAVDIEGGCESRPKVGNVQAAAVYQQAHYDWSQTRFEDLMASGAHLAALAKNLRATASTYTHGDAEAERMLIKILDQLDNPTDGTGH
ncbi:MAG: hypothetical protein ACRDQX_02465 [Pseudonocardiaceae bacterium]